RRRGDRPQRLALWRRARRRWGHRGRGQTAHRWRGPAFVRLERIGLVVNPRAGVGGERNQAVAEAVLAALAPCEVVAGPGEPSAAGPDLAHDITAADRPAGCTTPATTRRIAREAVRQKADALVVIGGDGTMADAVN